MSDIKQILQLLHQGEISKSAAYQIIKSFESPPEQLGSETDTFAVVGMSCHYPRSADIEEFWHHLVNGTDLIGPMPSSRMELLRPFFGDGIEGLGKINDCGYLEDVDRFDPDFFGISEREAKFMDPQQRIFLEVAYQACEDAGYSIASIDNSDTGVFIGNSASEYYRLTNAGDALLITGNSSPFICGRLSYWLNLKGPSMMVNTACSSSLVALHTACASIREGTCSMALVGGVSLFLIPESQNGVWDAIGITSRDKRCKPFDASANGIVKGEGCGVVLIKSLEQAQKDNDRIYAVIKGSAVNHDGHSNGLTSPNPASQTAAIEQAWNAAGVDPETISYIEAHGTGTQLGDPIEINGIADAFRKYTDKKQFCAVGSSKSNVGHLADGAAGITAFIKTVLALWHRELPATIHLQSPNPYIRFIDGPVYLNTKTTPWSESHPLRAGVSSFGLSGTNCHVVLEEAPKAPRTLIEEGALQDQPLVAVLSAHSADSLKNMASQHRTRIFSLKPEEWADYIYTCARRSVLQHRLAIVCVNAGDLSEKLDVFLSTCQVDAHSGIFTGVCSKSTQEKPIPAGEPQTPEELAQYYCGNRQCRTSLLYPRRPCRVISLPVYPFDHKSCWLDPSNTVRNPPTDVLCTPPPIPKTDLQTAGGRDKRNGSILDRLRQICLDILNISSIDMDSNFFELGGQSIKMIQLVTAFHQEFGVAIPLSDLFDHPTLRYVYGVIKSADGGDSERSIPKSTVSGGAYPLSSAQKRIYVFYQFKPDSTCYNMCCALEIHGDFHVGKVQEIMERLIVRHDSFRTGIIIENNEVVQRIADHVEFHVAVEKNTTPIESIKRKFVRPFDLAESPLLRVMVAIAGERHYYLLVDMHHIISDGTSMGLLIDEFMALYEERDLPPVKADYRDYTMWQEQRKNSEELARQRIFWLDQYADPVTELTLPFDFPRPVHTSYQGDTLHFQLENDLFQSLRKACASENVTSFVWMLAVYYLTLFQESGQRDIVVGVPVSGRNHADIQQTIGMFVNTLPIRCRIDDRQSVGAFIQYLRTVVLEAFNHQDYPFEELVNALNLPRSTNQNPLFTVCFVMQNMYYPNLELKGTTIKTIPLENEISIFDIRMDVREFDEQLHLFVEYNTDIFHENTINRFALRYMDFCRYSLDSPELSIGEVCGRVMESHPQTASETPLAFDL